VKTLNIYGQEFYHTDAFIVGTKEALSALRAALNKALDDDDDSVPVANLQIFASDGEGYSINIICASDEDMEKLELPYNDQDINPIESFTELNKLHSRLKP
jgi:hypothetical protein